MPPELHQIPDGPHQGLWTVRDRANPNGMFSPRSKEQAEKMLARLLRAQAAIPPRRGASDAGPVEGLVAGGTSPGPPLPARFPPGGAGQPQDATEHAGGR